MSTIRSRVRRLEQLAVPPPPPAEQSRWSAEELKLIESDETARVFARKVIGVMRDVYDAQPELTAYRNDHQRFLRGISTPMLVRLRDALANLRTRLDELRGA